MTCDQMAFAFSSQAAAKIRDLLGGGPSSFFRVRVDTGGCAGFQYAFLVDDAQTPDDIVFQSEGATVVVDELSLSFLRGAVLDYVEEMMGASFVISNPNAQRSCGCKNSFTP